MKNISIIIPSYNQAEYLKDAIDSVLNQTFMIGHPELIIVDDGSTDNSLEIAKSYGHSFYYENSLGKFKKFSIKVVSQVNKGLSSARNTGIMNASGDYILPLDADDILPPTTLHKIWSKINSFFPPDILALSFKTFGTSNENVILMSNPTLEDFKTGNRIAYCSAIKKSVLLEVGGYSPRMTYGYEDLHLWINLLSRGKKIVTIPEVLWLYRTKEHSMIHDAQAHHSELLAQINKDFPEANINF